MTQYTIEPGKLLQLQPGHVLVRNGKRYWIEDALTGKLVCLLPESAGEPILDVRVDPVLRQQLQTLESEYAWMQEIGDLQLYEKILDSHAARNHLDFSLEQTPVLPTTLYRRARLIGQEPKQIILIGDDDLLSLPLALLGHRVTVLEIDSHTIRTIRHFQQLWGLGAIEIQSHDLTQPIDPALRDRFDVCMTDPLSTYNCLNVFLSRGLAALREGGEIFLAVSDAGDPIGQHLAALMRLVKIRKYRDFNHYYSVRFVHCHYVSSYLRYQKNASSRPLIAPESGFSGDLFSFEKSFDYHAIEDFYECEVFTELPDPLVLLERIHALLGRETSFILPSEGYPHLALFSWKGKSVRIRLDAKRRWVGYDGLPLQRTEALDLQRQLRALLKPKRSVSRVAERNPGRD